MWGDLAKLIAAKVFKKCPKSNKLPNLVTLLASKNKIGKEVVVLIIQQQRLFTTNIIKSYHHQIVNLLKKLL